MKMDTNRAETALDDDTKPPALTALSPLRKHLIHLLAFSAAINLLVLALPVFMIQVFDRVLTSQSMETLTIVAAGAVMALAVMSVLEIVRSRLLARIGFGAECNLSGALPFYRHPESLRDISILRRFLASPALCALLDAMWAPLFLVLIFMIAPVLGWITMGGAALLVALAITVEFLTRARRMRTAELESGSHLASVDLDRARLDAHITNAMPRARMRWQAGRVTALQSWLVGMDQSCNAIIIGRFIRFALQVLLISVAATLVVSGAMTAGAMIAASVIAARALSPLERGQEAWRGLIEARAAFARLMRLNAKGNQRNASGARNLSEHGLVVTNVTLKDDDVHRRVLHDVSIEAGRGDMIGVTGPSGDGKSYLMRALCGISPIAKGEATFGDVELGDLTRPAFSGVIGYLSQSPKLIPGTIAENIAGDRSVNQAEIENVAKSLGLHSIIETLPEGYETDALTIARRLPAGHRQLLALARTLVGSPQLVLLDEPQTNLDNQGVEALYRTLEALRERKITIVLISQRPSFLARCDQVLVVSGGRVEAVNRTGNAPLRLLQGDAPDAAQAQRVRVNSGARA